MSLKQVFADAREPGRHLTPREWGAMSTTEQQEWAAKHLTPEEWDRAKFNVERALCQLIIKFPFFGFMVTQMAMERVWVTETQPDNGGGAFRTMATDGRKLYIWPQFALYHDHKMLTAVLLHELFHNILYHPARGIGYDQHLANQAMDYTVNLMVNDAALEMIGEDPRQVRMAPDRYDAVPWYIPVGRHITLPGEPEPTGYCVDDRFRDREGNPLPWEEIYQVLLKELPPQARKKMEAGQALGRGDTGKGKGKGGSGDELVDHHGYWKPGNRPADEDGKVNEEGFNPERPRRWAEMANAQCSDEKMRGTMPAGMLRRIQEWLHPPLPWHRLLQNYMKYTPGDFTWAPGDIRFPDPMPSFSEVLELTWITFGFDLSGSMSEQEVTGSVVEAQNLLRGFRSCKGRAYFWDARVHDKCDLDDFDGQVKSGIHGGGGTSIRPQFTEILEVDKIGDKTAVHVCFTDGYVDWDAVDPEQLPFDVLWVITNDTITPPEHRRYKWTRLHQGTR